MIYSIEIEEVRTGEIMVSAESLEEARKRAAEMFNDDPEHCVDWYDSEATFDGMTEGDMAVNERFGESADCLYSGYVEMVDTCVCCGDIVPEGRMVCAACEAKQGGEQNGRQACNMEQRESGPEGLAGRFRRGISRLFGR